MVTYFEFNLPLYLERKTQSFPHLRINKFRVFTKPVTDPGSEKKHQQDTDSMCVLQICPHSFSEIE